MSFFQEQSNDSNLQYDNAAFLYFIASALIVAAAGTLASLVRSLLSIRIPKEQVMRQTGFLSQQIANLAKWKRGKTITTGLFVKIGLLVVLVLLTAHIYRESRQVENKMKGFDPFEILGLAPGSTLREVKKAYRKLALEYHPDRNQGNPEAQAKFILISKSYQCFTDATKTANCFKYGNPDGAGSFRVGIGLPKLFIEVEYKWYVLPLVLSFFLIVVPCFMLNWSNRNKEQDLNGINFRSYQTLFATMEVPPNKYTCIAFIASYAEIYDHPLIQPISQKDRESLQVELTRNPLARRPVLQQFNDRQLQAFWELYKYSSGMGDFSHPELREVFERLLEASFQVVKPFAIQGNEGVRLMGNPDWTIRFVGLDILYSVFRFSRDYYNRSLTATQNHLWLTHLSLSPEERDRALQLPLDSIVPILHSKEKLEQLLGCCDEGNKDRVRRELSELPVYNCQVKVEVDGRAVQTVNAFDYINIKFRVARQAGSGFCALSNYPLPKVETLYLMMTAADSLCHFQKIEFAHDKHEYIGKVPLRVANPGIVPLSLQFLSTSYYMMDVGATLNLKVVAVTPEQENMRIEFHPDDINIEKGEKNFFEQLMDLQMDMEETELSDSEDEEEEGKEGEEQPLRA